MATLIVKSGDTVSALAKKYGMTLQEFQQLNPGITDLNKIYVGQTVNLPDSDKVLGTQPATEVPANILPADASHSFSPNELHLIKFSSDPTQADTSTDASTVWLFDMEQGTLAPFLSQDAFNAWSKENWNGGTLQDAITSGLLYTAPTTLLAPGKIFGSATLLNAAQGIQNDGKLAYTAPETPATPGAIDSSTVSQRYGQPQNVTTENAVNTLLFGSGGTGGLLNLAKEKGIDPAVVTAVQNDASTLHLYINAMAYGNYGFNDLLTDLKRREMMKSNPELANVKIISEGIKADQYYATQEGKDAKGNALLALPSSLSDWNYTINNLPKEAFDTLVKPFDWNSEEGKKLMSEVKTSYFDIMDQKLNATTEAEKASADYSYKKLQEAIVRNYGLQLSDDATTAWNQINQIEANFGARGLTGSGMLEEGIDTYLKGVRKADDRIRYNQATEEEQRKFEYYKNSATPEQIASLSDKEKADWGLKPTAEELAFFDMANLKAKFPDVPEARLQAYRDSILDENGNYRSSLYNTLFGNKLQLQQDKEAYQQGTVQYDTEGNITGGYGAIFNKALEEQNKRKWLELNGTSDKGLPTSGTNANAANDPGTGTGKTPGQTGALSDNDRLNNAYYSGTSNYDDMVMLENAIKNGWTPGPKPVATGSTGSGIPTGTSSSSATGLTPEQVKAGYVAIPHPSQIPNYQGNNTIALNGTLYGIPKAAKSTVSTPTQIPLTNTYSKTASAIAGSLGSGAYTPPAGYQAIAHPSLIKNYQPNNTISKNGTMYGIPLTQVASAQTKTTTPTSYTPPAGYEAIAHPTLIKNYQPNNTISKNGTLYGIPLK